MVERTQLSDSASHLYTYSCMNVMVQKTRESIDAYNTLTRIEQFNQKMISSKIALFLVAVLLCLVCLRRVTAQDVSVEFLTQQPSCSDEALILKCQLNFPSLTIRWEHKAFDPLSFYIINSVGNSLNTSEGRVVANLTTKNASNNAALFFFASIVTIYPPLNELNSTTLNNTNIICAGFGDSGSKSGGELIILLDGVPSSPANLSSTVSTSFPSVKVEWDPPLYRGQRQGIILYAITIKAINYTRSNIVNSTGRNTHIIQGGGETMIQFNKNYDVAVTIVGVCKTESDPARISVRIEASAPLKPSLSVNLSCSVGSVRANLQWQYGVSTIYTPPTDVVINISPGPPPPLSECDQVTLSNMTCTFMTATSTTYNIVMNLTNTIGTQLSDEVSFDSQPLIINDTGLKSTDPSINVSVNSLCEEDRFIIKVHFGVRPSSSAMGCNIKENITIINGGIVKVPSTVIQETGEEYCYHALLTNPPKVPPVVVINTTVEKNDSHHILIIGASLIAFFWCVSTVALIAVHFYWFLPIIKQDLSRTKVTCYVIGFIFAAIVFPIGLILGIMSSCKRLSTISPALQRYSYTTSHNSKMTLILFSFGAVISVIIFPLGFIALVIYYCGHKHIAEGLVRSAGIVGVVIVFPIGLLLLVASFLYLKAEERKKPHPKKKLSEMSNWVKFTVYIGKVITCYILRYFCKRKPVAENVAQEVTEAVYAIPTEPVKENRSQPGIRSNIAYGVRHAPPSIRNPAYGYGQELSRRGAQEQNQAGADDSPEYEDICNVPAEYEIPLDNRSQPRINGSGNTACGISQGSLTTANRRMQS